jgi:hypothetical protein
MMGLLLLLLPLLLLLLGQVGRQAHWLLVVLQLVQPVLHLVLQTIQKAQ